MLHFQMIASCRSAFRPRRPVSRWAGDDRDRSELAAARTL